ncbi:sigma-70 family RNA polymerase sigma factor [Arthrobacter sp. ISL-48]|uniref:sigma-70 family RNA polymerase sigma factor n=1 Tax=Arthrobacter sp. ISL-48 TaxID=2819110 RepID=UPI001BE62B5B|nr:sigma-70 family RNA polymerase sigma factor [Arthrobacter sp. ISL-48]MBT2531579.1 sigma-70 family RNA polymerase sigma factor [Arthrobacter sp. ISL-48]
MGEHVLLERRFEEARPRLLRIATQLLGSKVDAEDAVQETWLRLARVETSDIDNLNAWLTTAVSRICLDILRTPRRRREHSWHIEPWPLDHASTSPDPVDVVATADRVNVALLVVFETLTPIERIAFVLHDIFGQPYAEIALAVGKSPQATRKIASRARQRLREAPEPAPIDRRSNRKIVEAWLAAVEHGDLRGILELLDQNAVLHADFGATTQTVVGADDIAAQAVLSARLASHSTPVLIDGRPGVAAVINGQLVSVMVFHIADSVITALDVLADPTRLA